MRNNIREKAKKELIHDVYQKLNWVWLHIELFALTKKQRETQFSTLLSLFYIIDVWERTTADILTRPKSYKFIFSTVQIFWDIGSGAADLCKQPTNLARFKVTMGESVCSYKFHEDSRKRKLWKYKREIIINKISSLK